MADKNNDDIRFEDELEVTQQDDNKKNKGKDRKTANIDEKWQSILMIVLKYVLPPVAALIFGLIVGVVLMLMSDTSGGGEDGSPEASGINRAPTLRETIESVKDSQLQAVQEQLAALSTSNASSESNESQNEMVRNLVADTNEDVVNTADGLIESLINYSSAEGNAARDEMINAIEDTITTGNTGEEDEELTGRATEILDNQALENVFNQETIKSGATIASLTGVDDDGSRVYLTMTPFVSGNQHYHVLYSVKISASDSIIEDVQLLTAMRSEDESESERIYDVLAEQVREPGAMDSEDINDVPSFDDEENPEDGGGDDEDYIDIYEDDGDEQDTGDGE